MSEPAIYFDRSPVPHNERQAIVDHIVALMTSALEPFLRQTINISTRARMEHEIRHVFRMSADRGEMGEWGVYSFEDIHRMAITLDIDSTTGRVTPSVRWDRTALARFAGLGPHRE